MKVTRKQLSEKYGISKNDWNRKHDDLLEHLSDFFDIEEIKESNGRYTYEVSDELPEFVPKLERKSNKE